MNGLYSDNVNIDNIIVHIEEMDNKNNILQCNNGDLKASENYDVLLFFNCKLNK